MRRALAARRWAAARAEHDAEVAAYLRLVALVPDGAWHAPMGPGRWSPAALTLHLVRAYEFGRDAVAPDAVATRAVRMRLRVPPAAAWLAGRLLLPALLALRRFPRGAEAPAEVAPDLARAAALGPTEAAAWLARAAADAVDALAAAPRGTSVVHAYFGALPARRALRLLSAHTRHHARGLAAALVARAPSPARVPADASSPTSPRADAPRG